jgi:hypothetical protein
MDGYVPRKVVDFLRTTRRYIPEDSTLHNHRCENLKSCIAVEIAFKKVCVFFGIQFSTSVKYFYFGMMLAASLFSTQTPGSWWYYPTYSERSRAWNRPVYTSH